MNRGWMAKDKDSPLRVLFVGSLLVIVWLPPGHHVLRRQPCLIAPDEFRGDGEQGGISRSKAGVVMQLIKAKKIRELLLIVAVCRA